MLFIEKKEIEGSKFHVNCCYGNCDSYRLLRAEHGFGFSVNITILKAKSKTELCYKNHLESCICIEGEGEIITKSERHKVVPGSLYALNEGEKHTLIALTELKLISVFNPPLNGHENHDIDGSY